MEFKGNCKIVVAAVILAGSLTLVGCADGGTGIVNQPQSTSATPAESAKPDAGAAEGIAQKLGMNDFQQSSTMAPGATRWGEGTYDGSKVQIYEFANDGDYKVFLDSVKGFGIVEAQLVKVGPVVVAVTDQTKVDAVRAALG